jgi:3-hydroxyisobutyrate dehydrogenase-like beta-hydroxyacid dehydrogenase
MPCPSVGIIGLGLLGGAIAERLTERGLAPFGFDVNPERREEAARRGVDVAKTVDEVLGRCELILLSLPNGAVVDTLLAEVGAKLRAGQTIVDTTTAAPEQMIAHAEVLKPRGIGYVEAEVAGSSAQARKGEALVFAGGDDTDLAKCHSVLEAFAAEVHHAGPIGNAAKWKLVHNLILGLHRAVLAEGLVFAEALGLDAARLLEVLKRTPAASTVMTTKGPKMLARDFTPQATVRQHLKDVSLILDLAAQAQTSTPLSTIHAALLQQAIDLGHSDADNSAIIMSFRAEQKSPG